MAQPLDWGSFLLEEDPQVQTLSYWTLVVKPVIKVIVQAKASAIMALMLGKVEGRRRKGQQRMRWLDGITDSMDMGLGPLSMGFSRQEHWSGLPCPPPDLPDPGIKPVSPALQEDSSLTEPPGKPLSFLPSLNPLSPRLPMSLPLRSNRISFSPQ